jgi:extradiol dioxygenase family protein
VTALRPFHLAVPVDDLDTARRFYGELLGCGQGRSADTWIDWSFYGHQLVTHLVPPPAGPVHHNQVDGDAVPVPHFGVILERRAWDALATRLQAEGVDFVIEPHVRFAGLPGEQATMFLTDPAGNALEFKSFADDSMIFAT